MIVTLIGVDPGIRDTAATAISLEFHRRHFTVQSQLWSNVTLRQDRKIIVDKTFFPSLTDFVLQYKTPGNVAFMGVEGYRPRGVNGEQDQAMMHLVQAISDTCGAPIVDNTGIKKIVTEDTLQLFRCGKFKSGGFHSDRKSAARVALAHGYKIDTVNPLLAHFMMDNLLEGGEKWSFASLD